MSTPAEPAGPPAHGPPAGYAPPPGYAPAAGGYAVQPAYPPPPGWVLVRPTSTLAVIALVCVAVAPPVGILLAWLALKETDPVTGPRSGRELATVALWVNVGISAVMVLIVGAVLLQVVGSLALMLPVMLASGA